MDVGNSSSRCNTAVCSCAPYSSATNFIERSSHLSKAGSPGLAVGSGYEKTPATRIFASLRIFFPCRPCCAFVVRYVVLEPLLKVLKATLQNYGRLYILDVRAITWGTRCFPDYSLYIVFFIFFVMDELKSAHLFILADFYFIVIFSWRLSSFFLGDYRRRNVAVQYPE